jgi:hypothetical protein
MGETTPTAPRRFLPAAEFLSALRGLPAWGTFYEDRAQADALVDDTGRDVWR